jgi:hypothetical protein
MYMSGGVEKARGSFAEIREE